MHDQYATHIRPEKKLTQAEWLAAFERWREKQAVGRDSADRPTLPKTPSQ